MSVHVVARADELDEEYAGLGLRDASARPKHVHERTVGTELERHVHVRLIFETVGESNDVRVLQGLVDLDFRVELWKKSATAA